MSIDMNTQLVDIAVIFLFGYVLLLVQIFTISMLLPLSCFLWIQSIQSTFHLKVKSDLAVSALVIFVN